jgi:ABC-2 type transport system ATP-binding protein
MAVLYTTHYMEEAERLCDRVGIIDLGVLRAEGTRRELVALIGERDRVRLTAAGDLDSAARACAEVASVEQASVSDGTIDLIVHGARGALPRILEAAARAVEAVFLHLTGKALRD